MDRLVTQFQQGYLYGSGPTLAQTLLPTAPSDDPAFLERICRFSNSLSISQDIKHKLLATNNPQVPLSKAEASAWADVYAAYWRAADELVRVQSGHDDKYLELYDAWRDIANALIKGYSNGCFQSWTVPCLYTVGKYLRVFAIKADGASRDNSGLAYDPSMKEDIANDAKKNDKLEDAARVINRIFTICISDRSPIEESRKWGLYYTTNLLFKTYFKLNSISLSKNILRALQASHADIPPLESFPKSHVVTFKYYVGVICFLEENYELAEEHLTGAWQQCYRRTPRNQERILTYLIPCRLLTSHSLPSAALLAPFPALRALFDPVARCIRRGDLAGFDRALLAGEDAFVRRRIYLTLERGRDVALRNLLRKVYIAGGFEPAKEDGGAPVRRTRVPVAEFAAAIRLGAGAEGGKMDNEEVECLLANMIYKVRHVNPVLTQRATSADTYGQNLMKGYIARERGIVVLSKGAAFPGTGV